MLQNQAQFTIFTLRHSLFMHNLSFMPDFPFYSLMLEMVNLSVSDLFSVWQLFIQGSKATALESLEAMASGLYSELFTVLISLINRYVFFNPGLH